MIRRSYFSIPAGILAVLLAQAAAGGASTIGQAVTAASGGLVSSQGADGSWSGEAPFTGAMAAGLVDAYLLTGSTTYLGAAQQAGNYILADPGNLYGESALGLASLSMVAGNPSNNGWRTALGSFYSSVSGGSGGTTGYIDSLVNYYTVNDNDQSQTVLSLAQYTVGAYYVNATDRSIWRSRLIQTLGQVTDADIYPVMALAAGVWGLSKTGTLNSTLVNPSAAAGTVWYNVTLGNLPGMLSGYMVASGTYANSFYWRFDHTNGLGSGQAAGYTEDAAWGIQGLAAAQAAGPGFNYQQALQAAVRQLAAGVAGDGQVSEHIWLGGASYRAYAGEDLEALGKGLVPGDASMDGRVDINDLTALATNWLIGGAHWSQGDFTGDGTVDITDLTALATNWNSGVSAAGGQASVPEPASLVLLGLGCLAIMRQKRRPVM